MTEHAIPRRWGRGSALAVLAACAMVLAGCAAAPPKLQPKLDARKAKFEATAPPKLVKTFDRGTAGLREAGLAKGARQVGQQAPDFSLPDPAGKAVHLADLLTRGPVVLVWYRGGWCPYCNLQLQTYQQITDDLDRLGATMVAISPETPDHAKATVEKDKLGYLVVSDVGNKVARRYGLVYTLDAEVAKALGGFVDLSKYNGDASGELPLSATYVVAPDGTIRYAFLDEDYRRRAEPADILQAVRDIQAKRAPRGP